MSITHGHFLNRSCDPLHLSTLGCLVPQFAMPPLITISSPIPYFVSDCASCFPDLISLKDPSSLSVGHGSDFGSRRLFPSTDFSLSPALPSIPTPLTICFRTVSAGLRVSFTSTHQYALSFPPSIGSTHFFEPDLQVRSCLRHFVPF